MANVSVFECLCIIASFEYKKFQAERKIHDDLFNEDGKIRTPSYLKLSQREKEIVHALKYEFEPNFKKATATVQKQEVDINKNYLNPIAEKNRFENFNPPEVTALDKNDADLVENHKANSSQEKGDKRKPIKALLKQRYEEGCFDDIEESKQISTKLTRKRKFSEMTDAIQKKIDNLTKSHPFAVIKRQADYIKDIEQNTLKLRANKLKDLCNVQKKMKNALEDLFEIEKGENVADDLEKYEENYDGEFDDSDPSYDPIFDEDSEEDENNSNVGKVEVKNNEDVEDEVKDKDYEVMQEEENDKFFKRLDCNFKLNNGYVYFGRNYRSKVKVELFEGIRWSSMNWYKGLRALLKICFPREVLGTHSASGMSSPAHRYIPAKKKLNEDILEDAYNLIRKIYKVNLTDAQCRSVVTSLCSDSSKALKYKKEGKRTKEKKRRSCSSNGSDEDYSPGHLRQNFQKKTVDGYKKKIFEERGNYIYFGKNLRTRIHLEKWNKIIFGQGHSRRAIRSLLIACFGPEVLANSSATGKPSPAFPNRPAKQALDEDIKNDIIDIVTALCPDNFRPQDYRNIITSVCADYAKLTKNKLRHDDSFHRQEVDVSTEDKKAKCGYKEE